MVNSCRCILLILLIVGLIVYATQLLIQHVGYTLLNYESPKLFGKTHFLLVQYNRELGNNQNTKECLTLSVYGQFLLSVQQVHSKRMFFRWSKREFQYWVILLLVVL